MILPKPVESLRTRGFRALLNVAPVYAGTGGRVTFIAGDWREIRVEIPLSLRTRNYVGTIYGGSMYGAVDPIYMLMLMHRLGPEFIVWDKAFGTFHPELDGERIRYGIVKQLGSFNLLWGVFHEWIGIVRDVWSAPWRHKLSYLWRAPGWSHDGSRDTSDAIRERWRNRLAAAEAASS